MRELAVQRFGKENSSQKRKQVQSVWDGNDRGVQGAGRDRVARAG